MYSLAVVVVAVWCGEDSGWVLERVPNTMPSTFTSKNRKLRASQGGKKKGITSPKKKTSPNNKNEGIAHASNKYSILNFYYSSK